MYLCKPFEIRELIARMRAVLRPRLEPSTDDVLHRHGITLNLTRYTTEVDRRPLHLTSMEFKLLHLFMKSAGRVLTRSVLLEQGWQHDVDIPTRTIDVHILRLRKKLGAKRACCIQTLHGVGYRFN